MPIMKKSPLLYKYLISYVLALAVPLLLLGWLLYNSINNNYRKEIINYRKTQAQQTISFFESEYRIISSLSVKIAFDETINMTTIKHNDFNAKTATITLNKQVQQSRIIEDIYLHFMGDDTVYCSRGSMSINTMLSSDFNFAKDERALFIDLINYREGTIIQSINNSSNNRIKNPIIVLAYPLPYGSSNPYGTISFVLSYDKINKLLGLTSDSDFSFHILDRNMKLINSYGNNNLMDIHALSKLTQSSGNLYIDEKIHAIRMGSNYGLNYIIVYNNQNLQGLWNSNSKTFWSFVIIVVLSIFIASLMASKNYKPIKKIVDNILSLSGRMVGMEGLNEIEYLNDSIMDTIEKNKKLLARLDEQMPFMKEQVWLMLIKGETGDVYSTQNLLYSCGIEFQFDCFQVMVISLHYQKKSEIISGRTANLIKLMLSDNHNGLDSYIIELMRGELVVILNGDQICFENNQILKFSLEIQHILEKELFLKSNIALGGIINQIEWFSNSFNEAQMVLENKHINGYGNIFFYEEFIKNLHHVFWYPTEELVCLPKSLKQGSAELSKECIDNILMGIKSHNISVGMSKSISFDIINSIIRIVNEYQITEYMEQIESLSEYQSLDELKYSLYDIFDKICKHFNECKESGNINLKAEIIKYINGNYTDPLISLESIAEVFNLSDKYLSRFFYQQTGYKFADYLKRLRIDCAKKLLKETKYTVKEIVAITGYTDPASFTRTFGKLEGITPGKYREISIVNV